MVKITMQVVWVLPSRQISFFHSPCPDFFCDCSNGGAGVESEKRKKKETRKRNLLPTLHFWCQAAVELNVLGSKCEIIKIL